MRRGPGRPELYPIKKVIGFDQPMFDAIGRWRHQQTPVPNVSDAIRSLVQLGLRKPTPAPLIKPRRPAKRKDDLP
jgi:hypothetical protein